VEAIGYGQNPGVGAEPGFTKRCPSCAGDIPLDARVCRYCASALGPPADPVAAWIAAHFTLALSLVTLLFIAFELARVSGSETATILALIKAAGPAQIITGVLISQFSLLLSILVVASAWWFSSRPGGMRLVPLAVFAGLVFVAFFTVPWPFFVTPTVLSGYFMILSSERSRRRGRTWPRKGGVTGWIILVVIAVLGVMLLLRPSVWLPPENVTTTDRGVLVGYVVGDEGAFTTLLTPSHDIIREKSDRITGREVCALGSSRQRPTYRMRPLQALGALFTARYPTALNPPCRP
jgi:hypothetical protein